LRFQGIYIALWTFSWSIPTNNPEVNKSKLLTKLKGVLQKIKKQTNNQEHTLGWGYL